MLSRLLALLAVLLLVGSSTGVLAHECEHDRPSELSEAGDSAGHLGPCLCHSPLAREAVAPCAVAAAFLVATLDFPALVDTAPEALPPSIEHPPQLG